jgi:hypothetical protein
MLSHPDIERPEPRWPAVLAVLASAGLHLMLPQRMRFGPSWLVAGVVVALVAVAWTSRRAGLHELNDGVGYGIVGLLTAGLAYGLGTLVLGLVRHTEPAPELLRSATALWVTNVLVFATLYWRIDAGGPNVRDRLEAHTHGAFLFPQMTFTTSGAATATIAEEERWRPGYVDYLFLAFNTSTAFSPTDVPVVSRWAKLAMMTQSTISLMTIVLLAGRAVNIL